MKKHSLYDYVYSNYIFSFFSNLYEHCFNLQPQSDDQKPNLKTLKYSPEKGLTNAVIETFIDKCFENCNDNETGNEIATKAIKHILSISNKSILKDACKDDNITSIKTLNSSNIKDCYLIGNEQQIKCYENSDCKANCKTCSLHVLYKILCYLRSDRYYPLFHYISKIPYLEKITYNEEDTQKKIEEIYHKINKCKLTIEENNAIVQKYYEYLNTNISNGDFDYTFFPFYPFCAILNKKDKMKKYCNYDCIKCEYLSKKIAYDSLDKLDCQNLANLKLLIKIETDKIISYLNLSPDDLQNDFIETPEILKLQYEKICDEFISNDINNEKLLYKPKAYGLYYFFDILELHIEFYNFACKNGFNNLIKECNGYISKSIDTMISYIINQNVLDKSIIFKAKALFLKYYIYAYKNKQKTENELLDELFNTKQDDIQQSKDKLSSFELFDSLAFMNDSADSNNECYYIPEWLYNIQQDLNKILINFKTDEKNINPAFYAFKVIEYKGKTLSIDNSKIY